MKSKFIAFAVATVTLSAASLSFAQEYDHRRDYHQHYEQRSEQRSDHQRRWQDGDGQRRVERHVERYERSGRNDWRYGAGPVYVQPTYVQPGYYGSEQPAYVQQGYAQPSYYAASSASDAALAIFAGGLISELLANH